MFRELRLLQTRNMSPSKISPGQREKFMNLEKWRVPESPAIKYTCLIPIIPLALVFWAALEAFYLIQPGSLGWEGISGLPLGIVGKRNQGECARKGTTSPSTEYTTTTSKSPWSPTLNGMPRCRLAPPSGLIADPLLAALTRDFDPAWRLAPHAWRLWLRAQGHAADGAVHAHALVFTAGLEALPITVDHAVVLAACSRNIWQRGARTVSCYRDMKSQLYFTSWWTFHQPVYSYQVALGVSQLKKTQKNLCDENEQWMTWRLQIIEYEIHTKDKTERLNFKNSKFYIMIACRTNWFYIIINNISTLNNHYL